MAQSNAGAAVAWSFDDLDRLAGAIQDPTRRNILLAFYNGDEPLTVDQVANTAGVHRTVAFAHLERLVALGYLRVAQRRGFPGKPAKLYQRASDSPILFRYPARQLGLLADLLAEALAAFGPKAQGVAKDIGRRRGADLGAHGRTAAEVLDSISYLGGDYQLVEDARLVAGNCIFREACARDGALICGLHSGLLEGALASAGFDYVVKPEQPDGDTCAYHLEANPPSA